MASALINSSREVAGLFGITVIGAVLRARQSSALLHGAHPAGAFLDGYHTGLYVTIGLIAAGAVLSFLALRRVQAAPATVPAEVSAELPAEVPQQPEGRELIGAGQ
jgi:hypothetical protein